MRTDDITVLHLPATNSFVGREQHDFSDGELGDEIRLTYVGRLVKAKGLAELLSAVGQMWDAGERDLRLRVAGSLRFSDPEVVDALLAAEARYGTDRLTLETDANDERIAALFGSTDIFVMPSHHEGYCVPVVEALMSGCYVIGSDAANIPTVMGGLGTSYACGDVNQLVSSIATVLDRIRVARTSGAGTRLADDAGRHGTLALAPCGQRTSLGLFNGTLRIDLLADHARHSRQSGHGQPGLDGHARCGHRTRRRTVMTQRRISVVINTYNRRESLALTLSALTQLDYSPFEVIVVNGPSSDDTDTFLAAYGATIKVGHCESRNLSESRNIGIRLASGEIVAFIDDDAYPDPGWLDAINNAYDSPEVAAAGGPVIGHTGHDYQAWYSSSDRFGFARTDLPPAVNPSYLLGVPGSAHFVYTIGTNSSFRRDILVGLGGFDEEFEYYLDETDVCARIVDAGYLVAALDVGFVHHKFLSSDIREDNKVVKDWYQVLKSKFYFGLKHGLASSSFAEVCAKQTEFVEWVREDVSVHLASGAHDPSVRDKLEADLAQASNYALARYVEGTTRERPVEWFEAPNNEFAAFATRQPKVPKLHLCFLSQEYPPAAVNGIGRVIHLLATGLASAGHVVRVLTRGEDHDRVDLEDGVWVHRLVPSGHQLPNDVDVPAHIWNYSATLLDELHRIDRIRPIDVVQSPNWDSEGIAAILDGAFTVIVGLYTPLKTVLRVDPAMREGIENGQDLVPRLIEVERFVYQNADGYLACGPAIVEEIEGEYGVALDPERLGLVAHGLVDISAGVEAGPPSGTPRLLFVGRLESRKGIDTLLESAAILAGRGVDFHLEVIGDDTIVGPNAKTYRESFEEAWPEYRSLVSFLGRVDDDALHHAYAECDIFVAPSRFESFGLMLVEAATFAKPVVSADIGGMSEIVEDGATGLLVPPDDPVALAEALAELISSPEVRTQMGRRGRDLYEERFTVDAMVAGAEAVYQRLKPERSSGAANRLSA